LRWLRLDKSVWRLASGLVSASQFAWLLTHSWMRRWHEDWREAC